MKTGVFGVNSSTTLNRSARMGLLIVVAAACAVLVGYFALQGHVRQAVAQESPGPPSPPAIISNGAIQLGVNPEGNLGVPGGPPSPSAGTEVVGLRFLPTGNEAISPGDTQESWGVADAASGTHGHADESDFYFVGKANATTGEFTSTGSTARSVVFVSANGAAPAPSFRVTHEFRPSPFSPKLYEAIVTIENASMDAVAQDVRYRRVVDWDVEPTAFSELVTVGGDQVLALLFFSNDGFSNPNPLGARTGEATGFFADSGPYDQGATFDLGFGALQPGQKKTFKLFYGAAATEAGARNALSDVGADAYSLGKPDVPDAAEPGAPNTFVLGFLLTPRVPVAHNDAAQTDEDGSVTFDVLANDTDLNSDALTVANVNQPRNGSVNCTDGGQCTYAPNSDFNGTDSFTYTATDGTGESTPASVTITVAAVDDPPDTIINASPSTPTSNLSPTFSWIGSDDTTAVPDLLYSYKLDANGSWSNYSTATTTTLPNVSPGEHTFQVRAEDNAGNVDTSPAERTFTVDTTEPTVTNKTPASGATGVTRDTDVVVTFSEAMKPATVNTSTFTLTKQGGTTPVEATVTYDGTTNKATLNPTLDLDSQATYTATFKGGASGVKDLADNALAADSSWTFTVADYTPPTVTGVSPASGATGVPPADNVSATFSEEMDAATVSGSTFTLLKQGTTSPIPAAVSYDSATRKAILDPTSNLASATTYVATVKGGSGGVKDKAANGLATDKTWSFTTADVEAPSAPTIDLVASSDSGFSSTDNLTNDATPTLSGSAESGSTVKVKKGTTVLGTTSGTGTWSFTPATPLTDGVHQLTATATDAAGNESAASATLAITIDTTAPAATVPSHALTMPTQLSASAVPVRISWLAATDTNGIDRYELRQSTDGGATYTNVSLSSQDQTNRAYIAMLAPGASNYRFGARAVDRAGNGSWSAGTGFQVANYSETASAVTYGGAGWTVGTSTSFFGGSSKYHGTAGRKATLAFTGAKQVGWITAEGPSRGKARVSLYQGTTLVSSVTRDTYAASLIYRQMLQTNGGLDPAKSYRLEVEMLGTKNASNTTNSTRVDIDSFVVIW